MTRGNVCFTFATENLTVKIKRILAGYKTGCRDLWESREVWDTRSVVVGESLEVPGHFLPFNTETPWYSHEFYCSHNKTRADVHADEHRTLMQDSPLFHVNVDLRRSAVQQKTSSHCRDASCDTLLTSPPRRTQGPGSINIGLLGVHSRWWWDGTIPLSDLRHISVAD